VSTSLSTNRDFVRFWTAQTISKFGSHVGYAGVEFAAILNLRATPAQLGLLGTFVSAPVLLVGLLAGVWVDRARRRPLLIAADVGRAALLLAVPLLLWLGLLQIGQLYVIAALVGTLKVLHSVADQSALPALVRREDLVEANSRLGMSESLAEVGGPALGGILVQWLTAPIAILLDVLSFLLSALFIARIRTPESLPPSREEHSSLWDQIRSGLRVVWSEGRLRPLALSAAACSFFGNFIGVLYTLYLLRDLGFPPALVGASVGAGGLGALAGAFLTGPLTRRLGVGPTLIFCRLLSTALGFLLPLAGGPTWLAIGMVFLGQVGADIPGAIAAINETSLRQALIPDRFLGRASASLDVLVQGAAPLGALVGGLLGEAMGLRPTLYLAFSGIMAANLWLLLTPVRAVRELSTEMPE
jgi:predicted MFS family arabinose efflux permease